MKTKQNIRIPLGTDIKRYEELGGMSNNICLKKKTTLNI